MRVKSNAVEKMRADEREDWKNMGDLFREYEPSASSQTAKPSEWWVLAYQI